MWSSFQKSLWEIVFIETWSKYRKATGDYLVRIQNEHGSWTGSQNWGHIGPVCASAIALTILQLDKGTLPIYQKS